MCSHCKRLYRRQNQRSVVEECKSFFTGAEDIPLTGYDTTPTLMFDHTSNPFITASTCAVQLTLPTIHSDDQAVFDEKVIYALRHHGGFGLV